MKLVNAIPSLLIIAVIGLLSACSDDKPVQITAPETSAPPTNTSSDVNAQEDKGFASTEETQFNSPWAMTFLPDGRLLVTAMADTLRIYDTANDKPGAISGLQEERNVSQGGVRAIAMHTDDDTNTISYLDITQQ